MATAKGFLNRGHIIIENVHPHIDCGRYRPKAIAGDHVFVGADIYRDGHDLLRAVVRYRGPSDPKWLEAPLAPSIDDRWTGEFSPTEVGRYRFTIEAWTDHFATWRRDLIKKIEAGQDIDVELEEGALMLEARAKAVPAKLRGKAKDAVGALRSSPAAGKKGDGQDTRIAAALDEELAALLQRFPDRSGSTTFKPTVELTVDRERARFGAWYEFFPRSTGKPGRHGTFKTATARLPAIASMGFDVVYLPPIHPIGSAHRKGKNNSLKAGVDDVGVPWAIGSPEGGHKSIHPGLGTIDDFDSFVSSARDAGLEVALDFAIQCSPDHPWVSEHPEWFNQRPDGSIKYAENPPKKYQDIYPINFDTPDREGLWVELRSVLEFWISHGVKIFRVDNPHTKAFPFWEWAIESLKEEHPDLIFLAEAFTRPMVMYGLAKLGFTQSYTYFTWRNTKYELTEYMNELTRTEVANYFRPNFFANTPDILHEYLQSGGPPAFKIRLVLASLLSPSYGIYSGFEYFENVPREEGSEEYLDSEKYELKYRDWNLGPNLVDYITRINEMRRKHPAASQLVNLHFHNVDKENVIAFSKMSREGDALLAIVNLNPFHYEEGTVELDLGALGLDPDQPFEVHDVLTDSSYIWHGAWNYVRLDPHEEPAHIFRVGG